MDKRQENKKSLAKIDENTSKKTKRYNLSPKQLKGFKINLNKADKKRHYLDHLLNVFCDKNEYLQGIERLIELASGYTNFLRSQREAAAWEKNYKKIESIDNQINYHAAIVIDKLIDLEDMLKAQRHNRSRRAGQNPLFILLRLY